MKPFNEAIQLLEESHDMPVPARFDLPFPMGVFGTLRKGQCNDRRMHRGEVAKHSMAFMPHFVAHGLSISFKKNASAAFEIYSYTPEQWKKMIPGVDSLEGFLPEYATHARMFGYYRTLAWLHVLPKEFEHHLFETRYHVLLDNNRDLKIPLDQWSQYERVPCWVYSNIRSNEACREAKIDTIIWG